MSNRCASGTMIPFRLTTIGFLWRSVDAFCLLKPCITRLASSRVFPSRPGARSILTLSTSLSSTSVDLSSTLLVSVEEWRQYVPLFVIALVLLDIVMGSPVASSILAKARPLEEPVERGDDTTTGPTYSLPNNNKPRTSNKRVERMDIDDFAKKALERAQGVSELREYLEAQKTDWDRMQEIKQKMDEKMRELDEKNSREIEK